MGDINNFHGGGAATGATFPVALYVLFLPYLALLLVPCLDLMHVLSLMCAIKYACASVMLLSAIKLTRKLPNNPTCIVFQFNHVKLYVLSINITVPSTWKLILIVKVLYSIF
jgi:hypothetical protein